MEHRPARTIFVLVFRVDPEKDRAFLSSAKNSLRHLMNCAAQRNSTPPKTWPTTNRVPTDYFWKVNPSLPLSNVTHLARSKHDCRILDKNQQLE